MQQRFARLGCETLEDRAAPSGLQCPVMQPPPTACPPTSTPPPQACPPPTTGYHPSCPPTTGGAGGPTAAPLAPQILSNGTTVLAGLTQTASQHSQADLTAHAQPGSNVALGTLYGDGVAESTLQMATHAVGNAEITNDVALAQQTSSADQLLAVVQGEAQTYANVSSVDQLAGTDLPALSAAIAAG